MKTFAKGTKKRFGGGRSSSKKKKNESDDGGLGELFAQISSRDEPELQQNEGGGSNSRSVGGNVFHYSPEGSQSARNENFGSYSPKQQSGQPTRSGDSRKGSLSSSGSASLSRRRTVRHSPVNLSGSRPSLGSIGFTFQQHADDEKHMDSEVEALLSEIEDWKAKYFSLKDEYESLSRDYDSLLAQSQGVKRTSADVQEKDEMIRSLRTEVERLRGQPRGVVTGGDGEAQKKIIQQNDEIQKLLEQRISLEAELSELRYRGVTESSPTAVTPAGGFDQDRIINNLRATIKEKDDGIEELKNDLDATRNELSRLGGVMGLVADQVEQDEKKKKRTWWGGSKKKKPDPSKLTAAELDAVARDASMIGGGGAESPRSAVSMQPGVEGKPSAMRSGTSQVPDLRLPRPASDMAGVVINKRMLELERENARLQGEIGILEKEKLSLTEKLKRVEAQLEILQKSMRNDDANLKAIAVARSISVPMPQDGGSEADRLKVVVQLQEAALQRLSLKSQQLEDTLDMYTSQQGDIEDRMASKEEQIRNELSKASQEVSTLKEAKHRLEGESRLQEAKLGAYEAEVERLKDAIAHTQEINKTGVSRLKKQSDTYALMMGNLLKDSGSLQTELSRNKARHAQDISVYQGEVRALRDGRVKRLDGDRPDRRLFPSRIDADTILPIRLRELEEKAKEQQSPPSEANFSEDSFKEIERKESAVTLPEVLPVDASPIDTSPIDASSMLHYAWTPRGYLLQSSGSPAKPIISSPYQTEPRGNSGLRPVVTVEPRRGPGPFPSEFEPNLSPSTTGLTGYPEIDSKDQALAQSALREWFKHPSTSHPVSPRTTPEVNSRLRSSAYSGDRSIRSPAPPLRHRSPARVSPLVMFNPLSSRSDSKASLQEQPTPVVSQQQSDWGAHIPAALLSFGRPIDEKKETSLPKKSFVALSEESVRPASFELGAFPPQPSVEREPKKTAIVSGISPPSISHPLLGQSDVQPFQKKGIVSSESVCSSVTDRPHAMSNFPAPTPKPLAQDPPAVTAAPHHDYSEGRILGSEDDFGRRRRDRDNSMKRIIDDGYEFRERRQLSNSRLIDDIGRADKPSSFISSQSEESIETKKASNPITPPISVSPTRSPNSPKSTPQHHPVRSLSDLSRDGSLRKDSRHHSKKRSESLHPEDAAELGQVGELFGFKGNIEDLDRMFEDELNTPSHTDKEGDSEYYDLKQSSVESKKPKFEEHPGHLTNSFESQLSETKHTPTFDVRRPKPNGSKSSSVQFPDFNRFGTGELLLALDAQKNDAQKNDSLKFKV